jgi:hypothetical protein
MDLLVQVKGKIAQAKGHVVNLKSMYLLKSPRTLQLKTQKELLKILCLTRMN